MTLFKKHFLTHKNESELPEIVQYLTKITGTNKSRVPAIYVEFKISIWLDPNFN